MNPAMDTHGSTVRVLLTTVYRPFCLDEPFDSAQNTAQHGTCHRQFTREQGVFTIHQQCSHLALHIIAANIRANTEVVEYPTLDELEEILTRAVAEGRPYDLVGVTTVTCYIRKAREICRLVKRVSPGTTTVAGGGGVMAVGELVEPFADHHCRGDGVSFMRELLGQDPAAPIEHPSVWSVHRRNRILGYEANPAAYSLAVSLGCHRGCHFCATSAQFGHRRLHVLDSAEAIMRAMEQVDHDLRRVGKRPTALYYLMFDENFLSDEPLAREFLRLNRRQLEKGRRYLPFLFADAQAVGRYTPEELLEMGVDALWIGMEAAAGEATGRFPKNRDVDYRGLVRELTGHGIKVFISMICGLDEQTKESIDHDVNYALQLGASGFQYAICCPMPGTPAYAEYQAAGKLDVQRPEQINMSHYYLRHEEFDEPYILETTSKFMADDYQTHGPLALRHLELRLRGYRRHRHSPSAALRTRAEGFRNDILDCAGVIPLGVVFAPNPTVRQKFVALRGRARRELGTVRPIWDALRGHAPAKGAVHYLLLTNPWLAGPVQWLLSAKTLRADPRSRQRCATLRGLVRHRRECIAEVSRGVMPWDQPELAVTRYPRPEPSPPSLLARLGHRLLPTLNPRPDTGWQP